MDSPKLAVSMGLMEDPVLERLVEELGSGHEAAAPRQDLQHADIREVDLGRLEDASLVPANMCRQEVADQPSLNSSP